MVSWVGNQVKDFINTKISISERLKIIVSLPSYMISQKRTSILVSLLMLSMLAMPVLGNDAGTGGDAGDSLSTATNIPASNASYYGNLSTSGDVDDYYSVNMSNNTGIAVQLNSPSGAVFDLHLYSSSGCPLYTSPGPRD